LPGTNTLAYYKIFISYGLTNIYKIEPGTSVTKKKKTLNNPPEDRNGESQELLLQLLCGLLSILIVLILAKLSYDAWVYRTRGQLPWLVLKMP
jgi:hypothetical protein